MAAKKNPKTKKTKKTQQTKLIKGRGKKGTTAKAAPKKKLSPIKSNKASLAKKSSNQKPQSKPEAVASQVEEQPVVETALIVQDRPTRFDQSGWAYIKNVFKKPSGWVFFACLFVSFLVSLNVSPIYTVQKVTIKAFAVGEEPSGKFKYKNQTREYHRSKVIEYKDAVLHPSKVKDLFNQEELPLFEIAREQVVLNQIKKVNGVKETIAVTKVLYYELSSRQHWGFWSLFPAIVTILLCWLLKEPLTALLGGVISGAFLVGQYNFVDGIILPSLMTEKTAGVLILYLILLGALMGIWSRTGAARAFAEYVTARFVKGPKTAKLVAWALGIIFFQGGTVSTVLVGTTVKPIADKENISHEELSYIVDSTSSPIAILLAFNAWPAYVSTYLLVAGAYVFTENGTIEYFLDNADKALVFFFSTIKFNFYAIFAILGTLLLSIEKAPFLGKKMKAAIQRSREYGLHDASTAEPLSAVELEASDVPEGYIPSIVDFVIPLILLIGTALITFAISDKPDVRLAFGFAVVGGVFLALFKGMSIHDLISGFGSGLKGVVLGSVILLMAISIGEVSQLTGGGVYLVELLSDQIPYYLLPVILMLLTVTIAFSTGTSFGTYAVALPLAMPLAWAVASPVGLGLANPEIFMMICFAAVLNGSVMGDQCSPISDTTILSAMCTGCDLMDHVQTQLPPAIFAAILAAISWTLCAVLFCAPIV